MSRDLANPLAPTYGEDKKKKGRDESKIARENPERYARMANRTFKQIARNRKRAERKKDRQDNRSTRKHDREMAFRKFKGKVKNTRMQNKAVRKTKKSNLGRGGGEGCVMGKCKAK
jgi:hypothetical protein